MIFLDTNIFIIDLRYSRDPHFRINRAFLERVKKEGNGRTSIISFLELCGILSFNLNSQQLENLFHYFPAKYSVSLFPSTYLGKEYMEFSIHRLLETISRKLSFGDALLLTHIESHSPKASALVTWDAEHFKGKTSIPVLTPKDYMREE